MSYQQAASVYNNSSPSRQAIQDISASTGLEPCPTIDNELNSLGVLIADVRDMASQLEARLGNPMPPAPEKGEPLGMSVLDRLRAYRNTLSAARISLQSAHTTLG